MNNPILMLGLTTITLHWIPDTPVEVRENKPYKSTLTKVDQKKRAKKNKTQKAARKKNRK